MQLTQQIRIKPNEGQKQILWNMSEICRKLYNQMLSDRIEYYENDYDYSWIEQQNSLPKLKEKKAELNRVYSKTLQMVVRQVNKDFRSFLAIERKGEETSYPHFKGRMYFTTMVFNQSGFKVKNGFVSLSGAYKKQLKFGIPKKFAFEKIYQVSIYQKDGDFFVSIVHEKTAKSYEDNGKYQAVDLGVINIATAVNSNGKFLQIRNQRPDKYWQKRVEAVMSKQDHCKKRSKKWFKYHKSICRMKRKCADQMKDFQYKTSRKMIDNTKANTIIVGDLPVKKMARHKKGGHKGVRGLNRAMHNTGMLARFTGFLTYKAELKGKKVVKISEIGTTKKCCMCGVKKDRPLSERTIKCDCGNTMDRDENSSVNIMNRFLSQNAKWTGLSDFQANLRHTAECKTKVSPDRSYEDSQEAPCESVV